MTVVDVVARGRISSESSAEQVVCHPTLPLVAVVDSGRPAVHVWDCEAGRLCELGCAGAELRSYGDDYRWDSDRRARKPAVAWHPRQPLLAVANETGVIQWSRTGLCDIKGLPPRAGHRHLAFSPDGQALWASPSSIADEDAWPASDVLHFASGTVTSGPGWDTGVVAHPAGGLVATFLSDQGATLGLFARVDPESGAMRILRRALILDVDGYATPVFSPDGRHLAVRGNAYANTLDVFEFPSLRRVLRTALGNPDVGRLSLQEQLDEMAAWPRHNIAFGIRPGVLWIGTPTGTLVEVDLATQSAIEHDVPAGPRVAGLAGTASGELVVAGGAGELVLLAVDGGATGADRRTGDSAKDAVAEFLDSTSEVPGGLDVESHLVVSDGARSWEAEDLDAVTVAAPTDPTWLRLRAAVNAAGATEAGGRSQS